jgi:phosphoglycerate kinase
MLKKLKLQDIKDIIPGKRIFVRTDFNTPLKNGKVSNNTRIVETLPTIQKILESSPKGLVLASHLGRPDGMPKKEFSMLPVHAELEKLLGTKVKFVSDCVGEEALTASNELRNGEILLLENLRFHGEEEGSMINEAGAKVKLPADSIGKFRSQLTQLGDLYVNDAFGTSHRAHSSIVGINLPIRVAGLLMQKELDFFGRALENPEKPIVIVLGGAKVGDKLPLIKNLLTMANEIVIGGGMAFTFIKDFMRVNIGDSLYDAEAAKEVMSIMNEAEKRGVKIHLPVDFICGKDLNDKEGITMERTINQGIDAGWKGFDIGNQTIKNFGEVLRNAKTIISNGPMGAFEDERFAAGSKSIIEELVRATKERNALTIVGGGDTVNLVSKIRGAKETISHISTGGGASIELLEGKKLPGVTYLTDTSEFKKNYS